MSDVRLTRRGLFFTAGAGVLGVAVVNTLAGCADDSPNSPSGSSSTPAPGPADIGGWKRVDMSYVSAYLLVRGKEVAVVDLGTPGSEASIEEGLKAAGQNWAAVKHVILTHQHDDHVGGLNEVSKVVTASFYAGVLDVASIITDARLKPVKQGDEVLGLQIIDTPGHTLGHISVFDPSNGVLVSGDALRTNSGSLTGSDPQYTTDEAKAATSVKKLATMDIKAILPGHGEPVLVNASAELQKLAATL
ncbi:MBL fold metallo-hydrolase [Actinoplanes sp. KI2]|uniref:MBL fold metallo-hydrolase n=1 Tax=Actinoplanes sp. KI2 TaxID=2983315 RepID=UPI0021D583FD|nr:MBL fold metallo-hydrolase [Actinoplanes sp. KI2]MCU7723897.1 MBL fold metallo-hydrolase [Actinoplanes sp. KI2]